MLVKKFCRRKRREIKERNARTFSFTVRDVGYLGRDKSWMDLWVSLSQEGQKGLGSYPLTIGNEGNCKRMNWEREVLFIKKGGWENQKEAGKGKSC